MNISLPEDLIDTIEQLIIYEEMLRKEEERENFEFEYAYIEDSFEDTEENSEEDWKIEISMV
jgi:hypothetical protein